MTTKGKGKEEGEEEEEGGEEEEAKGSWVEERTLSRKLSRQNSRLKREYGWGCGYGYRVSKEVIHSFITTIPMEVIIIIR